MIKLNRRHFLRSIAAAAITPAVTGGCHAEARGNRLKPDPGGILDLPEGFSYTVVSRAGELMSDGMTVPGLHDGMAAFPGENGTIRLVCNHEIQPDWSEAGPLHAEWPDVPEALRRRFYDRGGDVTPGPGGTTTIIYNPARQRTERQFLSLGGTEYNCAGGPTPWGSWLSCEECFESPGRVNYFGKAATRDKRHGYVFEVPAAADELVEAVPIRAMGRFEHEACAVDAGTGIVYMTEDRHHSLFYRYIPDVPGKLHRGGRLQALAIRGRPTASTHNWGATADIEPGVPLPADWLDLDDVDPADNDLRLRGARIGAATFARGEGLCIAGDRFAFTCTNGGPAQLGQVFTYAPGPFAGTSREADAPGQLQLIAESTPDSLLRNGDNLTMAPWGDLIVCEDTANHCGLVVIKPDGSQYPLADNAYSDSELAGVCFSPDGDIMFVNIQDPGMTLAITGPWPS